MNRIKRYIDKEDFYLFYGVLFCIGLIIWFQFVAYDWDEVITQGKEVSDLVVNISLSYLAGWIVYMVSTFIPKINRCKKKSETLKPLLKEIVHDFEFNIMNSLLIPNQSDNKQLYDKYNNKPLSIGKEDLSILAKCIDAERGQMRMNILGMKRQPRTYKEQLVCLCLNQRVTHIQKLDKFNVLLDETALKLINKIEYSSFIKFASQQYEHFNDYCFSENCFLEHYQAVLDLNTYIEKKL